MCSNVNTVSMKQCKKSQPSEIKTQFLKYCSHILPSDLGWDDPGIDSQRQKVILLSSKTSRRFPGATKPLIQWTKLTTLLHIVSRLRTSGAITLLVSTHAHTDSFALVFP
jgi:hypothetical protein